ncbi:hypothetical protein HZC30_05770 [Candidatus Woesearchaeota archaeon]|nr:hypothetical protein [Candidatus Woesearchaeota archaeon]
MNTVDPDLLEEISQKKALHTFKKAAAEVPAYQKFLLKNKVNAGNISSINEYDLLVPSTDKTNYIKKYSFEERCKYGRLPKHGNIDESGGTSGKATNWIHDFSEETLLSKAVNFEYNYVFDGENKDYLVISAWSTGPWATGIKFCELMEKISLVKNTATDPKDIVDTLKMFGKAHHYLLSGYPPFIKNLLDEQEKEINWKDYHIDIITGGEGVPLEWVYYVKKKLKPGAKIVSSYGASDIDIGVGFETPLCFFIRELASKNEKLCLELFGRDELPMVFQYNPLMHYIQPIMNKEGKPEFEMTLLDDSTVLPKVKYNLHDEGKKFRFNEMMQILEKYEPRFMDKLIKAEHNSLDILNLPFLCIFGRSDGTLSFDGANVFPDQIEGGILKDKELARIINRFKFEKKYDKKHTAEFHILVELKKGGIANPNIKTKLSRSILEHLQEVNPDFRESYSKNKTLAPKISLYRYEHPLFKKDDVKVKNIYLTKA